MAGIPPSGRENPEQPMPFLLGPELFIKKQKKSRELTDVRRIQDGLLRAIKGLRGMRLFMVSPPES
jgi:hypothetical protein